MDILFSVIVPVYNIEKYLRQCVDSLLAQTYRNIEIILVDDGSPDNCPQICDEYAEKDSRIKVIHKQNGGLVSARKAGAELALGEFILCVDGDDYVSSDYVEGFVECLRSDDVDIVCCGFTLTDGKNERKKPLSQTEKKCDRMDIEREIFPTLIQRRNAAYFTPSLCGKAIKTGLYRSCQKEVDDRIKIGEDGACTIPVVYRANSLVMLSDCGYYYRQNLGSMTKNRKAFDWDGPRLIAEHLYKTIDVTKFDFQEQLYRLVTHMLFTSIVTQFYREEPYRVIKRDIEAHLNEPIYAEAIKKAKFSGSRRAALMMFVLRHRCYRLMQLWARVK